MEKNYSNKKLNRSPDKASSKAGLTHQVVCFGEALWDEIPAGMQVNRQAGGAPLNVAYHLQKLGRSPAVISRVGFDDLGKELIQSFESKHICTDYFQIDYTKPTSIVQVKVNAEQEVSYQIFNQVAWDNIQIEDGLPELVKKADYFIYGSLAARNKPTRETLYHLLTLAKIKVMDMNLRAPFYLRPVLTDLLGTTDILKLNLAELELVTGWYAGIASIEDRMKTLAERFQLQMVIVTKGGAGAVVYAGDNFYYTEGMKVEVADTIGSGDAFLAGMIAQLMAGHSKKEALNFANQLAGLISTKVGGCPDYQLEELKTFNTLV